MSMDYIKYLIQGILWRKTNGREGRTNAPTCPLTFQASLFMTVYCCCELYVPKVTHHDITQKYLCGKLIYIINI